MKYSIFMIYIKNIFFCIINIKTTSFNILLPTRNKFFIPLSLNVVFLEATYSLNAVSVSFGFLKSGDYGGQVAGQVNMVDGLKLYSLKCAASDE